MQNVGSLDRLVRILAGLALLAYALLPMVTGSAAMAEAGALTWVLALVGVVLLLTGLVRVCPAYLPFGINTCRKP